MSDQPSPPLPAISIALATYNGERFLAEQLESLSAQTLLPLELVVADDGSTDATLSILRDFAARAPFPVHVHESDERLGYRRNFRRAAQLCRGELISFCDQDDIWLPTKIATVAAHFADPGVLLVYHNVRLLEEGHLTGRLYDPWQEQTILAQRPLPPWHFSFGLTQTFRASLCAYDDLWEESLDHLQDEILAHDQWYFFLALALGKVVFIDEDLIHYRQHGANAYGSAGVGSRWQRFIARFNHHPLYDRFGSASAASKAAILRKIVQRDKNTVDAADAIMHYDLIAKRFARRYSTYTKSSIAGRMISIARSIGGGDYSGNPWGFDWKSVPRDMVTGVICGGAAQAG